LISIWKPIRDSFRIGVDEFESRAGIADKVTVLADVVRDAQAAGLLRVDRVTHLFGDAEYRVDELSCSSKGRRAAFSWKRRGFR
jgi:hypothetical protein